ncbi:Uncharacterised protein [uncultured archaeon]|nr:Uncharacterised protein [uncultured archaeon]
MKPEEYEVVVEELTKFSKGTHKKVSDLEYMNVQLMNSILQMKGLHENTVKSFGHLQMFLIGRFEAR